jgi:hypothetical protein
MDERTIRPRHAGRCGRTIRYKWQSGKLQRLHANSIDNAIFAELASGAQRALRVDAGRCESAAAGAAGAPVHGPQVGRHACFRGRSPRCRLASSNGRIQHAVSVRGREDFAVSVDRVGNHRYVAKMTCSGFVVDNVGPFD